MDFLIFGSLLTTEQPTSLPVGSSIERHCSIRLLPLAALLPTIPIQYPPPRPSPLRSGSNFTPWFVRRYISAPSNRLSPSHLGSGSPHHVLAPQHCAASVILAFSGDLPRHTATSLSTHSGFITAGCSTSSSASLPHGHPALRHYNLLPSALSLRVLASMPVS